MSDEKKLPETLKKKLARFQELRAETEKTSQRYTKPIDSTDEEARKQALADLAAQAQKLDIGY